MRIAEVIGTVTLSRCHPSLEAARWVIAIPFSLEALRQRRGPDGEDLVVYDDLHAGAGNRIGISEGGEAAAPFHPDRKPVDAYSACLLDQVILYPATGS